MTKHCVPTSPIVSFCGRNFSADEIDLMRQIASDCSSLGTTEIARTVCELLDWKRPTGHLKNHECRQLLERLAAEGQLQLPRLRNAGPRGPRRIAWTSASDPQPEITGAARDFEPLTLTLVEPASHDSTLWNEFVDRHHYLRYRVPVGAHLRYLVRSEHLGPTVLACLQWSSPAWKMAARDRWIGWNDQQRKRNLQGIVNQSRFLILPWVRVPGLASKILSHCVRQLPEDFERHYGRRPLLAETLVDANRFSGTCYRAANWIFLGETRGRGRMDEGTSKKLVYVYPMCNAVQQRLCETPPRQTITPRPSPATRDHEGTASTAEASKGRSNHLAALLAS